MNEDIGYSTANTAVSLRGELNRNEELVRALQQRGYNAQEVRSGNYTGINILSSRQQPSRFERLLGFAGIRFGPSAYDLGTLWVDNRQKGADHGNLVLESNGSDHVAKVSTLITELLSGGDVSVEVKLSKNKADLVRFPKGYELN